MAFVSTVGGVTEVEPVGVSPSREGGVCVLAIEARGSEHEGLADGRTLGLVERNRVRVIEVAVRDVLGRDIDDGSSVGTYRDLVSSVVDVREDTAGAVE